MPSGCRDFAVTLAEKPVSHRVLHRYQCHRKGLVEGTFVVLCHALSGRLYALITRRSVVQIRPPATNISGHRHKSVAFFFVGGFRQRWRASSKRWPPLSFRLITGYKMLTGIILISILGKCRESFTRSSGNLPSLVLPVHERACERIDARKGEGARRFDACDRRRDVRSALMLIAVRYEVHAVVGYERGRAAKSGPDCFVEHGFAAFPGWLWCGAL